MPGELEGKAKLHSGGWAWGAEPEAAASRTTSQKF